MSRAIRGDTFEGQITRSRSRDASPEGRETPAYIVGMKNAHELTSISDDELLRRLAELLLQSLKRPNYLKRTRLPV